MGVELDLSGLEKLEKNLEKIDGEHEVPVSELMTDSFIRKHTDFQTLQAFLDASGVKSQEDIGTEVFDRFVAANTRFENWQEMFKAAGSDWMVHQLEI